MRDDVYVRMANRGEHPRGEFFALLSQAGVKRGDHHVEGGQHVVGKIQRAIRADFDLGSLQNADSGQASVHRVNLLALLPQPFRRQPTRHAERLSVVGDKDVAIAARQGRARHLFDGCFAIAPGRVHLQIAENVIGCDQWRNLAVKLAAILAQLRRNVGHAQRAIDLGFLRAQDFAMQWRAALFARDSILVQAQPLFLRDFAQVDIVRLRAGKILQPGAPPLWLEHTQVGLRAVLQAHAGFGRPARNDLGHHRQRDETLHHRRGLLGGDEEIEIANRFLHPAQAARRGRAQDVGDSDQLAEDGLRKRKRQAQRHSGLGRAPLERLDVGKDFRLGFSAHARQIFQLAFARRRLQLGNAGSAEFLPKQPGLARADVLHAQQLDDASGHLGARAVEQVKGAGRQQRIELFGDGLAHAGDRAELACAL